MIYQFSFIEKILLSNDIIPHPFTDAAASVGLGFALGSAVKLKIADQLSMEFKPVKDIAQGASVDVLGAEIILDCLEALGYAKKDKQQYAFTKRGFKNLSPQSQDNFRYFILFCDYLYKGYLNLDETIRLGRNPKSSMLNQMSDYEWELFSRAMIDISKTNLKEVVSKIPVAKVHKKVLDLGGSHGLYSIELCKKHPQLNATILDYPAVKKYSDECIKKHHAESKVQFKGSDFMKDSIEKGVDVILAFNIIHGLNPAENKELATKAFESLNSGGVFVLLDQIKGIGGNSQMAKGTTSYMALNLLHQAGGKTYTVEEVKQFCTKAGFIKSNLTKLNAPGFGIITCYK